MKFTGIIHSKDNESIIVFGKISSDLELLTNSKKFNYFYLKKLQFFIPSIFLDRKIMSQKRYFDFDDIYYEEQKIILRKHLFEVLKFFKKY